MEGTTEIEALSQSYEHMVRKIQKLMKQVRQEEISLRKTELKALQAQINPHFLYNTLDAIGWLCEEERCQDAVEMVNALAKLFRISISKGHELIPIEKEVEHARSYLKIQNFRYKNQFSYEFQVEEDCLQYYCNKITLQPIIENAIYHGIEQMAEDTNIYIKGRVEGNDCVIEITDAGRGMTEEEMAQLRQKIAGELDSSGGSGNGIGLKNVQDRIQIAFGGAYGIEVASQIGCYTKIIVRIPMTHRGEAE